MPTKAKSGAGSSGSTPRPYCKICRRRIHVPAGWTGGPATRRHYWRKHRDHMLAKRAL